MFLLIDYLANDKNRVGCALLGVVDLSSFHLLELDFPFLDLPKGEKICSVKFEEDEVEVILFTPDL